MTPNPTAVCQLPGPWEASGRAIAAEVTRVMACDGAVLAVARHGGRSTDVLLAAGPLVQTNGDRAGGRYPDQAASFPTDPALARIEMQDEDPLSTWRLSLARRGEAFTERERALAQILLHQWHCRFLQPAEPGMARMLVRDNLTMLAGDLTLQAWMVDRPDDITALIHKLGRTLRHRYDTLADDQTYEAIVGDGKTPVWAKLRFQDPGKRGCPRHGCIELRMLEQGEAPILDGVEDERLARAIGQIDQRYADQPDLAELAKTACMSPFHFHRTFSAAAGLSPKQYVVARQLQVARWLLRARDIPIAEVAQRCGFSSHGHFTATFHRLTGVKPSVFRDRRGAEP